MEFQISSENLIKGLYRAQGIVEKRTAMPILSNVLIEAKNDGKVCLSATDLEVGMTCVVGADVKVPGSVAIGAKVIYEIVKNLKKQKITIKKLENFWAEVKSGSSEYRLLGMPVEEFQNIPGKKDVQLFKIDAKILKEMIEKTLYSASTEDARYSLNGCFIEKIGDDKIRMVATDGHRLSFIDRKITEKKVSMDLEGVIIPRKGLLELKRLFESESNDCSMGRNGNNLFFEFDNVLLVMRLIEGRFPDYRQVLPKEQKIRVEIDRRSFLDCLKRVSIFSDEKSLGIRIQFEKGVLRLLSSNPDIGDAKEEMQIGYKGSPMTVGFNSRYLDESLSSIDEEKIFFSLEDELSPCTVKPMLDENYTCVIMPMRI